MVDDPLLGLARVTGIIVSRHHIASSSSSASTATADDDEFVAGAPAHQNDVHDVLVIIVAVITVVVIVIIILLMLLFGRLVAGFSGLVVRLSGSSRLMLLPPLDPEELADPWYRLLLIRGGVRFAASAQAAELMMSAACSAPSRC